MSARPATLELAQIVATLEHSDSEFRRLVEPLSPAQLNWQPEGGKAWSIGQCIDHLAKSNRLMVRAMSAAIETARASGVPEAAGLVRLNWIERFFVGSLEPPPKRRLKNPAKATPASTLIKDELWGEFVATEQAVRDLALSSRTINVNSIRLASPFLRFFKYSIGAAFAIIAAHNRRHLWQAQRVREAPGFPAH